MSSVFFNKGENCIAAGRLFVEDSIHDQFVQKVVSSRQGLRAAGSSTQLPGLQGFGGEEVGLGQGTWVREPSQGAVLNLQWFVFSKKQQPLGSN